MPRCNFCNQELKKGTGMMFVRKDSKIFFFDSKKCEKNMLKLKREAKNFKWASKEKKK